MSLPRSPLLLPFLALLPACGGGGDAGADWPEPQRPVDVSGVVRGTDGPLPGARVFVSRELSAEPRREVAVADGDGRFEAEGLSARAWIWSEADGRAASARHLLGSLEVGGEVSLELLQPFPVGELRVEVVTPSGEPVPDAEIRVGQPSDRTYWGNQGSLEAVAVPGSGTTGPDGVLATWKAPGRRPLVLVRASGHPERLVYQPGSWQRADELRVVLERPGRIDGRVRGGAGETIVGGRVVYEWKLGRRRTTALDDRGTFQLENLPAGPFTLIVQPDDAAQGSVVHTGELAEGAVERLDLELDRDCSIVGELFGNSLPLAGWRVVLRSEGAAHLDGDRVATTASDGSFAFGACEGAATLLAFPPAAEEADGTGATGGPGAPADGIAAVPHALRRRVVPGERIRMVVGAHTRPSARAEGTIELGGLPHGVVPRLRLYGESLAAPVEVALDPRSGAWRSPALPPADYELVARIPTRGDVFLALLELQSGEDLRLATLPLPEPRDLTVELAEGAEVRAWLLEQVGTRTAAKRWRKSVFASPTELVLPAENGFVLPNVMPGSYELSVTMGDRETVTVPVTVGDDPDPRVVVRPAD